MRCVGGYLQDEYDDDGDLRPQYRRLSLHSAAASSRALLSAVSARILHVTPPPMSPSPGPTTSGLPEPSSSSAASAGATRRGRSSVGGPTDSRGTAAAAAAAAVHRRKYHSFRSGLQRSAHRTRLSFDSGPTVRSQPAPAPHNT